MRRPLTAILVCAAATAIAPAPAAAFKSDHHADPAKVFKKHRWPRKARSASLDPQFAQSWPCAATATDRVPAISSNAPQVKVIYAHPTGVDNFASFANAMQSDAYEIRKRIEAASGGTKSVRFDTGGAGGSCGADPNPVYLDIQKVTLSQSAATYNTPSSGAFKKVTDELKALVTLATPGQGGRIDYVVYLDDIRAGTAAGEADIPLDDSRGLLNSANQGRDGDGRLFALVYDVAGATASARRATFLHELSHNFGAVQHSAPHATGAGHCLDEQDIMCYDDNAPNAPGPAVCLIGTVDFDEDYDCNGDDYFNANPTAGTYLAQSWNAFDSVYLCPIATCDSPLTPPAVTVATAHPDGVLSLTASSADPIAHYEWDIDGDGVFDHDTGSTPALTPQWDGPDPRPVAVRASKADGTFAIDEVTVAPTRPTPSFSVEGQFEAGQTLQLDGSSTDDPDGQITAFVWDLDGDGTYETGTGLTRTATTSFAAPGEVSLGLQIDYPFGTSWTRTAPFAIAAAAPTTTPGGTTTPGTPPPSTTNTTAAPVLTATRVRLAKLLKSGLPLSVRCGAPCSVSFKLSVDARTARKLRLKGRRGRPVVISRLGARLPAGTTQRSLRLTAAVKKALKRARTVSAKLAGSVTQPPGSPLEVARKLTFRR